MKPPKLDLHGVSHGDAPEIIHKFVNDNWGTLELHIVTGYSVAMKKIAMGAAMRTRSKYNHQSKKYNNYYQYYR